MASRWQYTTMYAYIFVNLSQFLQHHLMQTKMYGEQKIEFILATVCCHSSYIVQMANDVDAFILYAIFNSY